MHVEKKGKINRKMMEHTFYIVLRYLRCKYDIQSGEKLKLNISMKWLQLFCKCRYRAKYFCNQCIIEKHMSMIFFKFFPVVRHPQNRKLQINGFS